LHLNANPHSSWAEVYDLAYEQSFGEFYRQLTDVTVQVIAERAHPPARIVDFGAGTGRLSIPLADLGFDVVAVDPCAEMLNQLEQKKQRGEIHAVCSKMEDFASNEQFDVALCVFTVLLYLLDDETLTKALTAAHSSLKSGGILLLDIPSKAIFHGHSTNDHLIERSVSVTNQAGNIFNYREELTVKNPNGEGAKYEDTFLIRYWPHECVTKILQEVGFALDTDLSDRFSAAGSHYHILRKTDHFDRADAASKRGD
jgi:2-polyprenyl-3-methyl-5-hydroxy-6-metoxy-1,4-benzoquinol methylase